MLLAVIAFLYQFPICNSKPLPPKSENVIVGWVSDPNGRGTLGLILSCLLTLGLCVWSAMHLNIPPKGEKPIDFWMRSIKWAALGVFIPELVVLSAWRQWLSTRKMSAEIEKILKERKPIPGERPRHNPWTITHSYYASMGGFVFDREFLPTGGKALFEGVDRLTLTGSGVLLLAQCGYLPDMDRESILDKSKADGLAKALVCVQAAWMVLQTIGRVVVGEPVTLLEVNTIGHIFCAFVIYVLWWYKPKEVRAATVLRGPWVGPLAAYMYMASRDSGKQPKGLFVLNSWIKPELSELLWSPSTASDDVQETGRCTKNSACSELRQILPSQTSIVPGALRKRPTHAVTALPVTIIQKEQVESYSEDEKIRNNRHEACNTAISNFAAVQSRFEPPISSSTSKSPHSNMSHKAILEHLVTTSSAPNWPCDFYLPGISGELMGMALWLSSTLYGGIHLAAWKEYFPTEAEQLLWRFSATYIAGSGGFWFVSCVVGFRWPLASRWWDLFIEMRRSKIEYAVLGLGAAICGIAYVLARAFLVVEAVVSLRKLPSGAYDTPDWTSVFPHF